MTTTHVDQVLAVISLLDNREALESIGVAARRRAAELRDKTPEPLNDAWYIQRAREEYEKEGKIEIDDDALVSHGSDPGAYVQAWVWVYNPREED